MYVFIYIYSYVAQEYTCTCVFLCKCEYTEKQRLEEEGIKIKNYCLNIYFINGTKIFHSCTPVDGFVPLTLEDKKPEAQSHG